MSFIEKRWPLAADILTDRRLALMLALGFSSGLPLLLVFSTQSAWLREVGVTRTDIGLMSYVALSYSLKFIWAPVIDAVDLPGLAGLLGRRRAWMLVTQLGVAIGLVGLAFGDPAHALRWTIASAFFVAFAGATQDVVIDAWRIDAAPPERQGVMSATYQLGYRLALLCAGAGALYIADYVSWKAAYLAMAAMMAVGVGACLLAPGPAADLPRPDIASSPARHWPNLAASFVEPLADLARRHGWMLVLILALVAVYRLPDFVSGVMANPLYIDLGFSKSDIATVSKLYGVWIGIAGAFAGGFAVSRLGLMPTLLFGGIAASASHLMLAWLAASGARLDLLTLAISVENFASGFAGTALIAYMSSLTSPLFAATQYALLSSLYALPGKLIGGLSGVMVDHFGYPTFFAMTSTIGIPVVLLCLFVWRHQSAPEAPAKLAPGG
ncbi:MFS transporter, PAT family, beta-lactamase induction signal transducer AmpG [Rhizobiales bacterium GAS191]|nr:MFS transporter, PAT family, beta-lactamase induction signal transducer AmpG [Rhizobiales bacterium GAS191]SEE70937.1 MFS transporter, PAT family, beta-lactamase induction signal transducer AmpG [Rhizobiales bacterium GAS188]